VRLVFLRQFLSFVFSMDAGHARPINASPLLSKAGKPPPSRSGWKALQLLSRGSGFSLSASPMGTSEGRLPTEICMGPLSPLCQTPDRRTCVLLKPPRLGSPALLTASRAGAFRQWPVKSLYSPPSPRVRSLGICAGESFLSLIVEVRRPGPFPDGPGNVGFPS